MKIKTQISSGLWQNAYLRHYVNIIEGEIFVLIVKTKLSQKDAKALLNA